MSNHEKGLCHLIKLESTSHFFRSHEKLLAFLFAKRRTPYGKLIHRDKPWLNISILVESNERLVLRSITEMMQKEGNASVSASGPGGIKQRNDVSFARQQEAVAQALRNSTKSGIFVDDPVKKPMPLSTKRFIPFPKLSFRGVRRTASGCSDLSGSSLHSVQSSRTTGSAANPWLCDRCSHTNENENIKCCALCGNAHSDYGDSISNPVSSSTVISDDSSNASSSPVDSGCCVSMDEPHLAGDPGTSNQPSAKEMIRPLCSTRDQSTQPTRAALDSPPLASLSMPSVQPLHDTQELNAAVVAINPFEMLSLGGTTVSQSSQNPFDAWDESSP